MRKLPCYETGTRSTHPEPFPQLDALDEKLDVFNLNRARASVVGMPSREAAPRTPPIAARTRSGVKRRTEAEAEAEAKLKPYRLRLRV